MEIFLSYRSLIGTSGGINEAGIRAKCCLVRSIGEMAPQVFMEANLCEGIR